MTDWNKNAMDYGNKKDYDNELKLIKKQLKNLEKRVRELEDVDITPELKFSATRPTAPYNYFKE